MAKIQKYTTPKGLTRWRVRWVESGTQKASLLTDTNQQVTFLLTLSMD